MNRSKQKFLIFFCVVVFLAIVVFCLHLDEKDKIKELRFVLSNETVNEEIGIYETDNKYYVFLPSYADLKTLQLKVPVGYTAFLDDYAYDGEGFFTDFKKDIEYSVSIKNSFGRKVSSGTMVIMQSENIPALSISLIDGTIDEVNNSISKSVKRSGTCNIIEANGRIDYSGVLNSISGRGNTTWQEEKKPYNIQFKNDVDLLGMGFAKNYCLLANQMDKSNLRNKIVYDVAKDVGLNYAIDSVFVDLYVDGQYLGLYILTERVEIGDNRVNINDLEESTQLLNSYALADFNKASVNECGIEKQFNSIKNNPIDISGGYLVEIDYSKRAFYYDSYFQIDDNYCFGLKSPKYATKEQVDYISDVFFKIENDFSEGKINEIIDIDSWTKVYLIQEIFANNDIASAFFYKDSYNVDDKVYAGPIWDFDDSLGLPYTEKTGSSHAYYARNHTIFAKAYKNDVFLNYVKKTYSDIFLEVIDNVIENKIDEYVDTISASFLMNQFRWSNLKPHRWELNFSTLDEHKEFIKAFLKQRKSFLNSEWNGDDKVYVEFCSYYPVAQTFFVTLSQGDSTDNISELSYENYTFEGWYDVSTGDKYVSNQPIYMNKRYIAKWKAKDNHKEGFMDQIMILLSGFIDNKWTEKQLVNYAVAGITLLFFMIVLLVLLVVEIRKNKRNM